MTYRELKEKIEEIIPDAYWDEDYNGQIVIYTNMTVKEDLDQDETDYLEVVKYV